MPLDKNFSWKNYARGRWREYRVATTLMERGYWVFRSIKSLGPADLIAVKNSNGWLVQVKMRKQPTRAEPWTYELDKLIDLGSKLHMRPMFAGNDENGHLLFWLWDILGRKWVEHTP